MTEPRQKIRNIGFESDEKGLYLYVNHGFSVFLIVLMFLWAMADMLGFFALFMGSFLNSTMVYYGAGLALEVPIAFFLFLLFRILLEARNVLPAFRRKDKGHNKISDIGLGLGPVGDDVPVDHVPGRFSYR